MGQYNSIRCPVCMAHIETDVLVERCPACKEYIADKIGSQLDGTGLSTARATGPGLKPLIDLEQDVY